MSKKLQQIVNEEIENGIDSKNIIISGFSQGLIYFHRLSLKKKNPLISNLKK